MRISNTGEAVCRRSWLGLLKPIVDDSPPCRNIVLKAVAMIPLLTRSFDFDVLFVFVKG
jgi:hypothetical protein